MSEIFKSVDELKEAFQIEGHPEYVEVTPYSKGLGFSVQREYPATSRYKPPVTEDGKPDAYAMIGVLYEPERRSAEQPQRVPISAKVGVYSRYTSRHWDYDFTDKESPTEESVIASKKTPEPVTLSAYDEFSYDHERDIFFDSQGNELSGIDIINRLYGDHLATVDRWKGLFFRWKLKSRNKAAALCEAMGELFKWLLRAVCGRSLKPDEVMRGLWGDYRPEDAKLLQTERIDVFGYKAAKNVIVTFCILLLLGYSWVHWTAKPCLWLKGIANNSLLAFAFSILSIATLDHAVPRVLLWLINGLNKLRFKVLTLNVKFK